MNKINSATHIRSFLLSLVMLQLLNHDIQAQTNKQHVTVIGAMRHVMWEGRLAGTIHLDTLTPKSGLYGLGPIAYLTGEIMIVEGRSYASTVVSDTEMKVVETFDIKAPFFGYANISSWIEYPVPDDVQTLEQLEGYIDGLTRERSGPFIFKMEGVVDHALIHVMNLPPGTLVESPADAHKYQVTYTLTEKEVDIVGFFSTEHQTIFTHHDTWLHLHLITNDRKQMGHLDELVIRRGAMKLYLPGE
jgi:acetolactate decarboxylase